MDQTERDQETGGRPGSVETKRDQETGSVQAEERNQETGGGTGSVEAEELNQETGGGSGSLETENDQETGGGTGSVEAEERNQETGGGSGSLKAERDQETGGGSGSVEADRDQESGGGSSVTDRDQESGGASASSETDARPPSSPMKLVVPTPFRTVAGSVGVGAVARDVTVHARRDDDRYYMKHKRRGVAIVFNHDKFDSMRPRTGTGKDTKSLTKSLQSLGFEVRVFEDLKFDAVREVLAKVAAEDHSDSDCLLVAVMSHGEQGGLIYARDHFYSTSQLWSRFTGNSCPSLLGKPKLFFIQACRGEGLDAGSRVVCDSVDSYSSGYNIPNEADVLVMYSTVEGYFSWRNPSDGSWFIQALCKELDENAFEKDLLTMLTAVCRRVALHHQSCVPDNSLMNHKLQMPALMSMLTRSVYFRKP